MKRISRRKQIWAGALLTALLASAVVTGAASSRSHATKPRIAYLSYAVANSYDAPMLAAAKKVAKASGARVTVFDAANDPKKQFAQLQTAASSKQYDAIIVQPIFGTALIPLIKSAIKSGVKVVNMDQVLGPNFSTLKAQVPGLSGNVLDHVPTDLGLGLGKLAVAGCAEKALNPCNIGYLYSVKVSSLDTAIRRGFNSVIAGHKSIKVVAEGETFYQHPVALKAAQTMLQARPDINTFVGADQGATGAELALGGKPAVLIGYGAGAVALKAIAAGRWYGSVAQVPATTGRLAMECAVKAVTTGKGCGSIDAAAGLPNGSIVTKANVSKFKAEWPG